MAFKKRFGRENHIKAWVLHDIEMTDPNQKMKHMVYDNLHYAWIIPFSVVENLPALFSGLFDVVVDTVKVAHAYLLRVRQSVVNMHEMRDLYHYDSDDDDETESVSEASSHVSSGSRMSTRSGSKKKDL